MTDATNNGHGLFREEVIEHLGSRGYGEILLTRPVSYTFLTTLFAAFAALLVVFFCTFSYAKKATVTGEVTPTEGLIKVAAVAGGVVTQLLVKEGESVKAGDVLAVVTNERASPARGGTQTAIGDVLNERRLSVEDDIGRMRVQQQYHRESLERRASSLRDEISRVDTQIVLQGKRVGLSEQTLKQTEDLMASHFVSAAQVREKQADLLDQQSKSGDLLRSKSSSERDLAEVEGALKDLMVQSERDEGAARRSIGNIEQDVAENEAKRATTVVATQAGTVASINVITGQAVTAGQPILSLVPEGSKMSVELYVASRDAGFIRQGMAVQLRYSAFSYQKYGQFTGRVAEVSGNAMRRDEIAQDGSNVVSSTTGDSFYRVRVALEKASVRVNGKEEFLKPGMAVEGSVVLDTRRLYEWVVEPLYAVTGRVG